MPIGFLHLNIEMAGSLLKIGKRQISFGVRDVTDLISVLCAHGDRRRLGPAAKLCPLWKSGHTLPGCKVSK